MKINLTKKQYRDLLLATCIGVYIRGGVDEREGKDFSKAEEIERHLLSFAKDFDSEDLVEEFHETLLPSPKLIAEYHDHYIDEHDEDNFWHELTTRLGQRDFALFGTEEEQERVRARDGWLTGVIDRYYEKYEEEFEEYGTDRLQVVDMTMRTKGSTKKTK